MFGGTWCRSVVTREFVAMAISVLVSWDGFMVTHASGGPKSQGGRSQPVITESED
jgi:hypothetical protein